MKSIATATRYSATARGSKGCSPASSGGQQSSRRDTLLALHLQGQHHDLVRQERESRIADPADPIADLQLAHLSELRRQRQRDPLRVPRRKFGGIDLPRLTRTTEPQIEPDGQPLPQARQIRQPNAESRRRLECNRSGCDRRLDVRGGLRLRGRAITSASSGRPRTPVRRATSVDDDTAGPCARILSPPIAPDSKCAHTGSAGAC